MFENHNQIKASILDYELGSKEMKKIERLLICLLADIQIGNLLNTTSLLTSDWLLS